VIWVQAYNIGKIPDGTGLVISVDINDCTVEIGIRIIGRKPDYCIQVSQGTFEIRNLHPGQRAVEKCINIVCINMESFVKIDYRRINAVLVQPDRTYLDIRIGVGRIDLNCFFEVGNSVIESF